MPQLKSRVRRDARRDVKSRQMRYTVGLGSKLAQKVEQYAETTDTSMSKAIAALVRIGLDSQAKRKSEFLKKLRENLANDDPRSQDRLVDEFRDLILGRQ